MVTELTALATSAPIDRTAGLDGRAETMTRFGWAGPHVALAALSVAGGNAVPRSDGLPAIVRWGDGSPVPPRHPG